MSETEWTPESIDRLMAELQAWSTKMGRELAKQVFTLHLTTLDGCTRTMQWQGCPPRELRTALRRKISFQPRDEALYEPTPRLERIYELRRDHETRKDLFFYVERDP